MLIPFPVLVIAGLLAVKGKKHRPSRVSGASVPSDEADVDGEANSRVRNSRVVGAKRRRNCARCVSR